GYAYDVGFGSPDRARLRVQYAVPFDQRGPLDPEIEYYAFKVNLTPSKSTGSGSCGGCEVPACIVLNSLQLFQSPEKGNDPDLTDPLIRNFVTWQGGTPNCPGATAVEVTALSAEAWSNRVRVEWQIGGVDFAKVWRRYGTEAWREIADAAPDGQHRVIFEDRDVAPGASYAYRLGVVDRGREAF